MSEFVRLLGNEKNIEYFSKAADLGKLSHAYIISGPAGSGKSVFADNIAAGLLCPSSGILVCEKCPACKKSMTKNHPDIIRVTHEKPRLIAVDEIRDQVVKTIDTKPFYGPYKIYIIEDADLMNDNGQNALLKTIEEPPAYAIIFLLTSNPDGLLETVHSRCITIEMEMLSDDIVADFLVNHCKTGESKAAEIAAFARGNLGLAEKLSKKEETGITDTVPALLTCLASLDAFEVKIRAQELADSGTEEVLDTMMLWFRDVLVRKSADGFRLYFPSEAAAEKAQADMLSYETLNDILNYIEDAKMQISFNVGAAAALDGLLLRIRSKLQEGAK